MDVLVLLAVIAPPVALVLIVGAALRVFMPRPGPADAGPASAELPRVRTNRDPSRAPGKLTPRSAAEAASPVPAPRRAGGQGHFGGRPPGPARGDEDALAMLVRGESVGEIRSGGSPAQGGRPVADASSAPSQPGDVRPGVGFRRESVAVKVAEPVAARPVEPAVPTPRRIAYIGAPGDLCPAGKTRNPPLVRIKVSDPSTRPVALTAAPQAPAKDEPLATLVAGSPTSTKEPAAERRIVAPHTAGWVRSHASTLLAHDVGVMSRSLPIVGRDGADVSEKPEVDEAPRGDHDVSSGDVEEMVAELPEGLGERLASVHLGESVRQPRQPVIIELPEPDVPSVFTPDPLIDVPLVGTSTVPDASERERIREQRRRRGRERAEYGLSSAVPVPHESRRVDIVPEFPDSDDEVVTVSTSRRNTRRWREQQNRREATRRAADRRKRLLVSGEL